MPEADEAPVDAAVRIFLEMTGFERNSVHVLANVSPISSYEGGIGTERTVKTYYLAQALYRVSFREANSRKI